MRKIKWGGLVVCATLGTACAGQNGAADDGEAGAGAVANEHGVEPTATTSQALVDGDGDRPMVAYADAFDDNGGDNYLDVIDKNGNLREQIVSLLPNQNGGGFLVNWGVWTTIDGGLQRTPTHHVYANDGAIDMYAMGRAGDEKLYEYLRRFPGDTISSWDVSTDSGFGHIADSPKVVDWGPDGAATQISIAVTSAADGNLYTIDWDPGAGWVTNPVWNGSSPIQTTHTIQSTSANLDAYNSGAGAYFAGRGLSASDTNTGWIAHRAPGQFGQPFTVYTTFSGVASTPYVWGDDNEGSVYVYAVFGSQLKYAKVQPGSLSWHVANNCAVAGSPTFNSIRGTNGHLLHFVGRFADSSFGCSDIGEGLTSSPFAMEAPADQLIFFRGNSGGLWAKDVVPNSPEFGNHWSLGISLP